ncbi:hypothetical protein PR048_022013 [Dryococelus australis]|uniref:Uncharacterized protein n=1 Tax=Dryococelus australis TaxID=614101 RepID=A0ABQ9GZU6_9NEOP|nr:hypothetical protein PR048_022013 [Dryococelus australis]
MRIPEKRVSQRHRPVRFPHAKIRERPDQESNPVCLGRSFLLKYKAAKTMVDIYKTGRRGGNTGNLHMGRHEIQTLQSHTLVKAVHDKHRAGRGRPWWRVGSAGEGEEGRGRGDEEGYGEGHGGEGRGRGDGGGVRGGAWGRGRGMEGGVLGVSNTVTCRLRTERVQGMSVSRPLASRSSPHYKPPSAGVVGGGLLHVLSANLLPRRNQTCEEDSATLDINITNLVMAKCRGLGQQQPMLRYVAAGGSENCDSHLANCGKELSDGVRWLERMRRTSMYIAGTDDSARVLRREKYHTKRDVVGYSILQLMAAKRRNSPAGFDEPGVTRPATLRATVPPLLLARAQKINGGGASEAGGLLLAPIAGRAGRDGPRANRPASGIRQGRWMRLSLRIYSRGVRLSSPGVPPPDVTPLPAG